ncbi:hypothetical protein [Bradyrhizobium sp. Tv2a-2]|uniref:hypothetical protein n=1 Tax=Bradyrhizobium sp. Tv2a-2 TaxID=113395 RepID=UPI0018DD9084|nr:hypothetical protein [Bradyrhizobium sp. Tv2a-2]
MRSYDVEVHRTVHAIAAAVTNAQAGLNWLRAQPLDVEEVRQALDSIASDGKRHAKWRFGCDTL